MMKLTNNDKRAIRDALASYLNGSDLQLICSDIGLSMARIDLNGPLEIQCHNLLEEAERFGPAKIAELLEAAIDRAPVLRGDLEPLQQRLHAAPSKSSGRGEPYSSASNAWGAASSPAGRYGDSNARTGTSPAAGPPYSIFICYARKDDRLRDELLTHLAPLKLDGLIQVSLDSDVLTGENWREEVRNRMLSAHAILLLLSPHFLASEECYKEMLLSFDLREESKSRVLPILIKHCNWQIRALKDIQTLPTNARPVEDWPNRDQAWVDVVNGVRRVIESL